MDQVCDLREEASLRSLTRPVVPRSSVRNPPVDQALLRHPPAEADLLQQAGVERQGEGIPLDQKGITIQGVLFHLQPAAFLNAAEFPPVALGRTGACYMAAGPRPHKKYGMGGLVLAQGGGKGTGLLSEFVICGAGEKHPVLPLGWRKGPDRIARMLRSGLRRLAARLVVGFCSVDFITRRLCDETVRDRRPFSKK